MKKTTLFAIVPLILLAGCKWFSCCDHPNHSDHTHHHHAKTVSTNSSITVATDTEMFDTLVLKSNIPVLVDFSADWCGACKAMKSTINAIANEANNQYKVVEVNVDKASYIAQKYGIRGIPTFTIFKDGKEVLSEANRMVGVTEKDVIKKLLEANSK